MNADNVVIINGRLVKDVELKTSNSDISYARFTVAVNRSRKDNDGNYPADFLQCVAFGKTAETVSQYFSKGDMIGVMGEIQDNNHEKDGVMHYEKQILVDRIGFRNNKQNNTSKSSGEQEYYAPEGNTNTNSADPFKNLNNGNFSPNNETSDLSDDELPF